MSLKEKIRGLRKFHSLNQLELVVLDDVIVALDEVTRQIKEKETSVLEMFCQQGPPSKRWIGTKGEYWKGRNEAIVEILALLDSEKK